jgi:hypothetical protein
LNFWYQHKFSVSRLLGELQFCYNSFVAARLLIVFCLICLNFVRIYDLSKCWIFWDQSVIIIDWFKLYNKATCLAIIAAFSVLFEAPQKYTVIWFFHWTVFCQFLICLIFIDLSGWLSDDSEEDCCAQAWRTSQAWWSRHIKLKSEYQIKCLAQKNCIINVKIQNDLRICQILSCTHYCTVHSNSTAIVLLLISRSLSLVTLVNCVGVTATEPRHNAMRRWRRSCLIILRLCSIWVIVDVQTHYGRTTSTAQDRRTGAGHTRSHIILWR